MKALVAEMVGNFTKRLGEAYGLQVRELTGGCVAALEDLLRPGLLCKVLVVGVLTCSSGAVSGCLLLLVAVTVYCVSLLW
jgi:hypothetical protein